MRLIPRPLLFATAAAFAVCVSASIASAVSDPADQPMRIVQTQPAEYPITGDTLHLPNGRVRVVILVGADGRLEDTLVTSYSHEVFARAAVAALRGWRYEPARHHGEAIGARREVSFEFEPAKAVVNVVEIDQVLRTFERVFPWGDTRCVATAKELDHPLAALPASADSSRAKVPEFGSAVLDFYVDADGVPRMPVLVRADHEALATAAHASLRATKFTVPTTRGRPTAVRVRQEFRFGSGS